MIMKRIVPLLVMVFLMAFAVSCGKSLNDWKIYNTASDQFTTLAEQYERYYQLQSEEEKEDWKKKFDPVFIRGDAALTEWRKVLNAGEDSTAQMEAFMSIKSEIIALLFELTQE